MENCGNNSLFSENGNGMIRNFNNCLMSTFKFWLMLSISGSQASESSRQSVSVTGLVSEILLQKLSFRLSPLHLTVSYNNL